MPETAHADVPMKILVTGTNGLIGSDLVPFLEARGHRVIRLIRERLGRDASTIIWHPDTGEVESQLLDGFDAVVHLAGENIADARWTPQKKALIRDSRVRGTRLLCETLARLSKPPRVLVAASAIGIYGSRGEESLTEASAPGQGFLADVCREWEAAMEPAKRRGVRLVPLRFGMVLSPDGGALWEMLLPFQFGLGGPVAGGAQFWSWISLLDAISAIEFALRHDSLRGPVNAVAPLAVTNAEFSRQLGHALRRPAVMPIPAWAVRLAFGEMADETLLASARVEPKKLLAAGFQYQHPTLEVALHHLLRTTVLHAQPKPA